MKKKEKGGEGRNLVSAITNYPNRSQATSEDCGEGGSSTSPRRHASQARKGKKKGKKEDVLIRSCSNAAHVKVPFSPECDGVGEEKRGKKEAPLPCIFLCRLEGLKGPSEKRKRGGNSVRFSYFMRQARGGPRIALEEGGERKKEEGKKAPYALDRCLYSSIHASCLSSREKEKKEKEKGGEREENRSARARSSSGGFEKGNASFADEGGRKGEKKKKGKDFAPRNLLSSVDECSL